MAHPIDGFELKFTSRTSWKAERTRHGQLIDTIPVTWTKGWRRDPNSGNILLEVWYQDTTELHTRNGSKEPFVIALAVAKDYSQLPHQFSEFTGVFEVVATGNLLGPSSLECKALRRLRED